MSIRDLKTYDLIKEEELKGIQSKGYLMRHKKSGARVLLIENDDENKVFSIGFRTPPSDSTGVPHIMEHSVLCGSKNFPAKDPFVELVKGSLNTFLNAMTYPDKTVYPVASCNDKDFQNLMHVYMDAVLYPNIYEHEETFRQEGWSYKLDSADDKLSYNGVVYNEMKGAFSSPEGVLDRVVLNTLFPDTSYANESGGDPEVIPELTYEQFLDFHRTYYHPSNSYIYLYGDMDMEEKLCWLDREYLCHYEKKVVDSEIHLQEAFSEMKELEMPYSIASDESEDENTYLSYNKVIGTSLDRELYLAFEILDYALLSAPGAPLKTALTDAGIGQDIMGSYDNGIYQPIFSVIAKNADADQKDKFIEVIENVLTDIVKNGMDQKALEAGINYHEFRYREADFGNYPKGLMYGLQIMDSWLYDDDKPFIHIEALDTFAFLKKQVGTRYYEDLIQKYLLDNTHGAIVIVKPEKGRTARMDAELDAKLQEYKASLGDEEIREMVSRTKKLEEYQSEPESEEALERIPVLNREDISREIDPIFNEEMNLAGVPVVFHEIETNGIGYVDVMFDLSGVSAEELPYVGILQSVLGIIDTENYGYGELFNEINMHTGGIGTSLELYNDVTNIREKVFKATFEIKGKALYPKLEKTFEMMGEILTASKLNDTKRIKEILAMTKSRLSMKFQSSGHTTAALRALSYASPSAKFKDMTNGIDFYQKIVDLSEHFEEEKESITATLINLTKKLFRPDNMMISYTASKEGMDGLEKMIANLSERLYKEVPEETPCIIHCEKKNEGFKTASKVQYVARTGNFIDNGAAYTGALQILKVILSYDYLWQNIRVKGGAYGCMSNFNRIGEGYFVSYRDPNLKRTIEVYEGIVDYLKNFTVSDRDMTKYIIGTISNIDQPMTPATKGERSMNLYMNKVSADMIREERSQILDATQDDIRALYRVVEAVLKADQLCVVGSEDKIEENKELFKTVTSF
ncbi:MULTISPECIES: insulinase family protein [Lachnospiraceae]|uniref:insulinase family protein n=1 Tax=Lachnospiraceae TaxID=186803 RepID=UPI001F36AA39|nr:insulinase family protein [Faecalicatena contorta]MCF2668055.1 insulinase family protein [Faecalicatena contorta]